MFDFKNAIIPKPAEARDTGKDICLGEVSEACLKLSVCGEGEVFDETKKYLEEKLTEITAACVLCGNYEVKLTVNPSDPRFEGRGKSEAYIIDVKESGAHLVGFDEAGAYYAAVTFPKLLHSVGGKLCLRECFILDYPYFKERGHFMECRYGSDFMTLEDWKKGLRYFSEMKINTITVGLYGCWSRQYDGEFAEYLYIPFKKHPELSTPRHIKYYSAAEKKWVYKHDVLPVMFTEDYFGEMIKFGKKCNIKVIPLFNSMGHNTLIPRVHPEISAKDENGKDLGVGFCTSNEKTYDILFDIYDEIIERYLKPNGIDSFEVGLDEIWDVLGYDKNNLQEPRSSFCKCEKCKNMTHAEIMTEHMIRLVKHLKEKGMKNVYVYHDMFFENDLLDEKLAKRLKDEGIFDTVVIDWWSYTGKEMLFHGKSDKVNGIFRGIGKPMTGYYHWNMPSHANPNIYAMLDVAMKNKFEGMTAYSSFEYSYDYPYNVFAECTWNPSDAKNEDEVLKRYALVNFGSDALGAYRNMKIMNEITECMYPMTPMQNLFSYYMSCYLRGNTEYPQNYPAKQFKAIYDDEKKYLPYLRDIVCRAGEVYNYFSENITSDTGGVWALIALTYKALADEFYTIYTYAAAYNAGELDESDFVSELLRLIKQRDRAIALCERVRIPANRYTCIRNMSVARQFTEDLYTYMKSEITAGRKPEVDILNYGKYLSKTSMFLR